MRKRLQTPLSAAMLVVSIGLSSVACSREPEREPSSTPAPVERPGPSAGAAGPGHQQALDLLRGATTAETYRIDGMPDYEIVRHRDDPKFKDRFLGDWVIAKRGPVKDRDFAEKITAFLTDEQNFMPPPAPGNQKACAFVPGVAFRLRSGDDYADVVVCYTCKQLVVESSKGQLRLPSVNFDPGYDRLKEIAKEAFPDDSEIRQLP